MLRIPNPGSDLPTFIRIFRILFTHLETFESFTLDDMSTVLTNMNLASSGGYMGEQALQRSTRKDRSRDSLYNQSKSYSELYRLLGWIQSREDKALAFRFTYHGAHVANAHVNPKPLVLESLLGINYPNQIIDNKSDQQLRPFGIILKAMNDLDGVITRDELILGPLNLDDRGSNYDSMISTIRKVRQSDALGSNIEKLSRTLEIQTNTMQNYTRFPLSALKYSGWVEPVKIKFYKTQRSALGLTDQGRQVVDWLNKNENLYLENIQSIAKSVLPCVIRVSFFEMLERSGFDIETMKVEQANDFAVVRSLFAHKQLIFSPFQTVDQRTLDEAFSSYWIRGQAQKGNTGIPLSVTDVSVASPLRATLEVKPGVSQIAATATASTIRSKIEATVKEENGDIDKAVSKLVKEYSTADKTVFYPLIADLFNLIGFNCVNPRHGVNYQRWDAIILDPTTSIPIEIKSPSEEEHISVKAIRQALENKVVLLSRKSHPTDKGTTTLAVGYFAPNDRSEVSRLISDIFEAYGIKIAVFDFASLLKIASLSLIHGKSIDRNQFNALVGIVDVEDI